MQFGEGSCSRLHPSNLCFSPKVVEVQTDWKVAEGIEKELETAHVNTYARAHTNSWQQEQHLMFTHYPQFKVLSQTLRP